MSEYSFEKTLAGRRVFLTGHTGFTGSWLARWLSALECQIWGYSLPPHTEPNLYTLLGHRSALAGETIGNILDTDALVAAMTQARPSVVFHLAAQPLVRRGFEDPLETFATNALGTANVLEAARATAGVEVFVCVTTDKVYDNLEWVHPYRETDRLGGKDPYSASKACAEIITDCYRRTLSQRGNGMRIATVRGGNIIGGGDWSADRIVPDFYRALKTKTPLVLRNPGAVRPWQHVLSACHGYLGVAAHLVTKEPGDNTAHWNIGPADPARTSVGGLTDLLSRHGDAPEIRYEAPPFPEAHFLSLDVSRMQSHLGIRFPWTVDDVAEMTAQWYSQVLKEPGCAPALTDQHLALYRQAVEDEAGMRREPINGGKK